MEQPSYKKKGLQKKFVMALLIAGFLPGIVALFATYLSSKKVLTHSIGTNFQEIAFAVAKEVEIIILHDFEDAEALALSPEIRRAVQMAKESHSARTTPEALKHGVEKPQALGENSKTTTGPLDFSTHSISQYFRDWEDQRRPRVEYSDVVITDQWGFLIASSYDINSPSLADRQWFKSSFQNGKGGYYLSNIYFNEEKKDYYYDVAVPIREPKFQEVLGVLKLGIRRDKLLKAIIEVKIGKTGHAMLVSSLGNPMICPILPPGDHIINKPLMAQISQPHAAWAVAKDDAHGGKQSIVGFAPIQFARPLTSSSLNQTQWYTFIRQHPDETYSPVYNLLFKVGVQGFGLVFVISFLGFLAGQRIVKPILLLKKRAQSIGQASYELATQENPTHSNLKLKERINIQTGDEIEELSQAFNQMSLALEENLQTIKKQQKELAQKEKLASVGQLLAGLTHDLKNPLGVIRSSAQILMGNEESEQVKKEMGRYIIEEVDRLTFRINDFLRFARHRLPEQREIQIQKVVEETLKQWGSQGGILNKITVHKKIDPSLPSVFVDPEQLNEILFNLLNNAREAMPQGGTITLRAERNGNDKVVTSIQDTGEGISPEDLDKIFDPFFTQKQYGIGLGLTNVKRLTEDNGGQVLVHSKTGQGSTFSLHFPVVQSSSQDQE